MIKRLFTAVRADSWQFLNHCDVLLVCGDNDRGHAFKGKRYAQFIDSIGDLFSLNGVSSRTVAARFSRFTGVQVYGEPVSMNRVILGIVLGARLVSLFKGRIAGENWRKVRETELWKKVLAKCRPIAVIGIQPDVGLCRAGHELGVKVFDLQHGMINDTEDNPYYWFNNLEKKEAADLPHGFLCWDKSSAEVLFPMAMKKGVMVRVIGSPWFARFRRPDARDALVREEMAHSSDINRGLPSILVTLQYNLSEYAHDYVPNGVMAACLEQTIVETCNRYLWYLRLHPSQLESAKPIDVAGYLQKRFGNFPNVEWDQCSRMALPLLLACVDLHITHYSATTIEAAWLGVRTGLIDPHIRPGGKHAKFFEHECTLGLAQTLPFEATEIKLFIKSALTQGKPDMSVEQDYNNLTSFVENIKSDRRNGGGSISGSII